MPPEQRVIYFERLGEPVHNIPRNYPGPQGCAERFMTFPKIAIAEPMDKITAADKITNGGRGIDRTIL